MSPTPPPNEITSFDTTSSSKYQFPANMSKCKPSNEREFGYWYCDVTSCPSFGTKFTSWNDLDGHDLAHPIYHKRDYPAIPVAEAFPDPNKNIALVDSPQQLGDVQVPAESERVVMDEPSIQVHEIKMADMYEVDVNSTAEVQGVENLEVEGKKDNISPSNSFVHPRRLIKMTRNAMANPGASEWII